MIQERKKEPSNPNRRKTDHNLSKFPETINKLLEIEWK